ncbi:DNA repair protein SWI5 homolog, partial [Petaurus breviceps papuanus]|uniref:DNA repair protein SWI5 homolog n=1 Tax=Petaurus breviceps papuanus TaxID=3040969 RepID=UPI0036D7C13A
SAFLLFSRSASDRRGLSGPSFGSALVLVRGARLGLPKRHSAAFRSPVPTPKSGQADETSEDSLRLEIQELKQKRDTLDQEISQLMAEGYVVSELEDHISLLHEYNDIKDVGQMLMGKLGASRNLSVPKDSSVKVGEFSSYCSCEKPASEVSPPRSCILNLIWT